jgi:hypothetical protein
VQTFLKIHMKSKAKKLLWAVITVLFLSVLVSAAGFFLAWLETNTFCYALDDSFIMMALAKNLAFHDTWGLTRYQFSSTASSPLFAVILAAAFRLAGDQIWMPLFINLLALAGLFLLVARLCIKWQFRFWQIQIMLAGLFIFMPVPVLLFGSMEHILHLLIALYCLMLVVEYPRKTPLWIYFISGLLLSSVRYEGLFEGALLLYCLWRQGLWLPALSMGIGMLVPVSWLGFYSMGQGWFFLPNSLILKAYGMNIQEAGSFGTYLLSWLSKAANHPHCMVAMLALIFISSSRSAKTGGNKYWLLVVLGTSVMHFVLARYGHVYRYEAYVMGLSWLVFWKLLVETGIFENGFSLMRWIRENAMLAVLCCVLLYSPVYRFFDSYLVGSKAMVNIYEQQVQAARFIQNSYNLETVAAIDVGAIAYYSDCRLQDLWGLGTMDFARLKLQNRYQPHQIDSVCRQLGVNIAVAYGNPMKKAGWKNVESWVIRDNRVCSRDTIDFYALSEDEAVRLKIKLGNFHKNLPDGVKVLELNSP